LLPQQNKGLADKNVLTALKIILPAVRELKRMNLILFSVLLLYYTLIDLTTADRESVRFDFGWRFYEGVPGSVVDCPASAFPINRTGVQCVGLKSTPATDADSCRNACCNDMNCQVWQYW